MKQCVGNIPEWMSIPQLLFTDSLYVIRSKADLDKLSYVEAHDSDLLFVNFDFEAHSIIAACGYTTAPVDSISAQFINGKLNVHIHVANPDSAHLSPWYVIMKVLALALNAEVDYSRTSNDNLTQDDFEVSTNIYPAKYYYTDPQQKKTVSTLLGYGEPPIYIIRQANDPFFTSYEKDIGFEFNIDFSNTCRFKTRTLPRTAKISTVSVVVFLIVISN